MPTSSHVVAWVCPRTMLQDAFLTLRSQREPQGHHTSSSFSRRASGSQTWICNEASPLAHVVCYRQCSMTIVSARQIYLVSKIQSVGCHLLNGRAQLCEQNYSLPAIRIHDSGRMPVQKKYVPSERTVIFAAFSIVCWSTPTSNVYYARRNRVEYA